MIQAFENLSYGDKSNNMDWRGFVFDFTTRLDILSISGKNDNERATCAQIRNMINNIEVTPTEELTTFFTQVRSTSESLMIDRIFYGILAQITRARARAIVRYGEGERSGAKSYTALRDRFSCEDFANYSSVLNFNWGRGSIEDRWRSFLTLVHRLPRPLPDECMESMILSGLKSANSHHLCEYIKLRSPMKFEVLTQTVDKYITTMKVDDKIIPMDVDQIDHTECNEYDDEEYVTDEDFDVNAVSYGRSPGKGTRKGKGKGKGSTSSSKNSCPGCG